MHPPIDLQDAVLAPWRTSSRVTAYLIEQIPSDLWSATVPGVPTRTIRAIGASSINRARSSLTTTTAAAPSFIPEALPAVTEPSF